MNLPSLTRRGLNAVFRLGPAVVRTAVYVRPPAFNRATGWTENAEIAVNCQFVGGQIQSASYLGLAPVIPGTEKLIVRAGELSAINSPASGDYLIESLSGLRRNVEAARLDPTGEFYTLQTVRSADEDWGDLTAHSLSEDFGDLMNATAFEERGGLN